MCPPHRLPSSTASGSIFESLAVDVHLHRSFANQIPMVYLHAAT
jgi:hypothetical protein